MVVTGGDGGGVRGEGVREGGDRDTYVSNRVDRVIRGRVGSYWNTAQILQRWWYTRAQVLGIIDMQLLLGESLIQNC